MFLFVISIFTQGEFLGDLFFIPIILIIVGRSLMRKAKREEGAAQPASQPFNLETWIGNKMGAPADARTQPQPEPVSPLPIPPPPVVRPKVEQPRPVQREPRPMPPPAEPSSPAKREARTFTPKSSEEMIAEAKRRLEGKRRS